MNSEIIFDEDYADITYSKDFYFLSVLWKETHMTNTEYRETYTKAINFGKKNKTVLFLSDLRKQQVMSPSERKWFQTVIVPAAKDLGVKFAAIVMTGSIFKKYYINHIHNTTDKMGIKMKIFSTKDEAENWLLGQDIT